MTTRGPRKLFVITYEGLAELTGLAVGTLRNLASAGEFDPRDLDGLIRWVNTRRAAKGWPAIGAPAESEPVESAPTVAAAADSGGYDPLTASYPGSP